MMLRMKFISFTTPSKAKNKAKNNGTFSLFLLANLYNSKLVATEQTKIINWNEKDKQPDRRLTKEKPKPNVAAHEHLS